MRDGPQSDAVLATGQPWRGHLQVAKAWGWSVIDALDYVSIARLYGCEYSSRQAPGAANSIVALLQPPVLPTASNDPSDQIDFSGDYVRIVSGVLSLAGS
jgi:hypothetical protein